jgi:hypothetical protein
MKPGNPLCLYLGDDLDELYAAQEVVFRLSQAANNVAEKAWRAGDDPASEAADAEYDAAARVLATIEARIWELQEAAGNPELREQRRDYYASR